MEGLNEGMRGLQEKVRLGEARNIYYYDSRTTCKQSIPTIVDNRFWQALNQLGRGSNTFIISADEGISDILFSATLPADGEGGVDYTNLALCSGWLYAAIARISIRYAGSSQYFWTGTQVMIENLREMPNPETRDQLFQLGGLQMGGVLSSGASTLGGTWTPFAGDAMTAYAYLNFPHNSPNGSLDKPNPFPSEMIGQPLVVTCELNYLPDLFSAQSPATLALAPKQFASAYFQVKQVHAKDRGDLMARSSDMSKAYSFPTKAFYQNEIQVALGSATGSVNVPGVGYALQKSVLLTGFRNGQVRSMIFWITRDQDMNPSVTVPTSQTAVVRNYVRYYRPRDIQLLYNGTVYYYSKGTSSEFWNLVSTETPSQVVVSPIISTAGDLVEDNAYPQKWLEIPFSQVYEQLSGSHMYVEGKEISNSVVNLDLAIDVPDTTSTFTLHAMYAYNCTILVAGGDASYIF